MSQVLVIAICFLKFLIDLSQANQTTGNFGTSSSITLNDETNRSGPKKLEGENDDDIIELGSLGRSMIGLPDPKIGEELLRHNFVSERANPEEMGPYTEGDLLIPSDSSFLRNGWPTQSRRWKGGVIPYKIGGNFSDSELQNITQAIEKYHTDTCLRFVPQSTQKDYILFNNSNTGCWSSVGRGGGEQILNLQSVACFSKTGTILHEMMHSVGFVHEQSRPDRDDFVKIAYENIPKELHDNFIKLTRTITFDEPYDYGSILHYSPTAFSTNGNRTVIALVRRTLNNFNNF